MVCAAGKSFEFQRFCFCANKSKICIYTDRLNTLKDYCHYYSVQLLSLSCQTDTLMLHTSIAVILLPYKRRASTAPRLSLSKQFRTAGFARSLASKVANFTFSLVSYLILLLILQSHPLLSINDNLCGASKRLIVSTSRTSCILAMQYILFITW